jgi:beta-lactam-binding protein with PASTA domain
LKRRAARDRLTSSGLAAGDREPGTADSAEPTVQSQGVKPGTLVARGTKIPIRYVAVKPGPAVESCVVPDAMPRPPGVTAQATVTPDSIRKVFTDAGLIAQVNEKGSTKDALFVVQRQSVEPGTKVPCSSTVVVEGVWSRD